MDQTPDTPRELELELYAGLKVLQEKQSEINRRLGIMERSIESLGSYGPRIAALEASSTELTQWRDEGKDTRSQWRTWAFQLVGSILLTSLTIWLGAKLGVNLYAN